MLHFPEQFFGIRKPDIFFFSDEETEPKERVVERKDGSQSLSSFPSPGDGIFANEIPCQV